jgi:hypothetical protein
MSKEDITRLMIRAAGLVLLTISLLSLPKALGASLTLATVLYTGLHHGIGSETELDKFYSVLMSSHISQALSNLASFIILLLLARWLFRGPKLLMRWMEAQPSDSPNGGPATSVDNSNAPGGPPSVN